jgi:hypothetical protein
MKKLIIYSVAFLILWAPIIIVRAAGLTDLSWVIVFIPILLPALLLTAWYFVYVVVDFYKKYFK